MCTDIYLGKTCLKPSFFFLLKYVLKCKSGISDLGRAFSYIEGHIYLYI